MNGIDISGHQSGINLSQVPCDFVIIKATQGTTFVSKDFTRQVEQALSLNKLTGVYHYASGVGVEAEVNHFIDVVKPYLGKVILAIDWENNKNKSGVNDNPKFVAGDYKYCEQLLTTVKQKTGVTPFLYMSKSVARQFKWEVGKDFPFWCAQYKKTNVPTTYVSNPWTDTKGWGAWTGCKILQYSSIGRLKGYNADLDLDLAYLTADEWNAYTQGTDDMLTDTTRPTLKKGDRGEKVRLWQQYLNEHGFNCGNADGIFGDKTEHAVMKYQQAHGMEAGYIGNNTWNTL